MKKALIMAQMTKEQKTRLECSDEYAYVYDRNPDDELLQSANVIIGLPKPGRLKNCENLEYLQLTSSGADAYVKPGVLKPGTILLSSTGAYSQSVAESAFAMTLCLIKKLHLYRDDPNRHVWSDRGKVTSLRGATVLIVGLGAIGLFYAGLVKAMGAPVIGVKRRPSECPECVDELYLVENLESLLPRADVVCSILPGTEATYHFYNKEKFSLMKNSAVFINVGRGTSQDEEALRDALLNGEIAAAGVDVFEKEPLSEGSPLWDIENLLITPHATGGDHMDVTLDLIAQIAADNFNAYVSGKPLRNVVDFETGYVK